MINKIRQRLRDKSGETLAEVLISLLVSALALVLLAGIINASSTIIQKTDKTMKDYYGGYEELAETGTAKDGTVTITLKNEGATLLSFKDIEVDIYTDPVKIGGKEIMIYKG